MSTEKTTHVDFSTRLSILVGELTGGNAKQFAEEAGIKQGTFHNYMKGRMPSSESLINICSKYNVNINWLLTGKGPKYLSDSGDSQALDPDPKIADLLEDAKKVLTCGNPVALDALERNIKYFSRAVDAEKLLEKTVEKLSSLEKRLAALEEKNRNKAILKEDLSLSKKAM